MDISRNFIKFIVIILLGHLVSCSHSQTSRVKKIDSAAVERKISSLPLPSSNKAIKLFLPLSGPHQNIGNSMLKAVMMAMYDSGSNYQVDPTDTLSRNFGAEDLQQDKFSQKYKVILGPLYYGDTKLVIPYAKSLNLQLMSFSNNAQLAQNGVFVVGLTPDVQLEKIVSFASAEEKIDNYFLLLPENQFGDSLVKATKKLESKFMNLSFRVYIYSDLQNLEEQFYNLANDLHNVSSLSNAIIFPEGGDSLRVFTDLYGKIGRTIEKVKLFGFDNWLDSNIYDSLISDSYIVSKNDREYEVFVNRYHKINKAKPNYLTYQAYCAARVVFKLLAEHEDITRNDILHNDTGWLDFDHDGIAKYNLEIVKFGKAKK